MSVSLIAALDHDHAIGKAGMMPWHLPDDLKHFKALTTGKVVLMGYRTAQSIGRTLPGRQNLVLSRRHDAPFPGQETVRSLDEALAIADGRALMVIGGGEVYRLALPLARRMFLTWVDQRVAAADTFFPRVRFGEWVEVSRVHHPADTKHACAFDFVEYVRE